MSPSHFLLSSPLVVLNNDLIFTTSRFFDFGRGTAGYTSDMPVDTADKRPICVLHVDAEV